MRARPGIASTRLRRLHDGFLIVGFWLLLLPREAHAYLDAGSGSLIIQAVVAGAATAMLYFRRYWAKVKAVPRRRAPGNDAEGDDD